MFCMLVSRRYRIRPGRTIAVVLLIFSCIALTAQSTLNPPVDGVFDWDGRSRTLQFIFENKPVNDVPGAAKFAIAPCPDGSDPVDGTCKMGMGPADCPYNEPNPDGAGCPVFTIAGAVRRAMAAWNMKFTKDKDWTLAEGANAKFPTITVRMSRAATETDPEELSGNLPDLPADGGSDYPVPGQRIDNPKSPPSGNGNDPSRGVLAFFQCTNPGIDGLGAQKACKAGVLVFNRNVLWGIDKNENKPDGYHDPIIVALHEIGHALRLDHDSPEVNRFVTIGGQPVALLKGIVVDTNNKADGNVMRGIIGRGAHNTNPTKDFARNPYGTKGDKASDSNSAAAAAANPIQK